MNLQIDDFQVVEIIGEGSYGTVFLVEDENKNQFALKKVMVDPFKFEESEKEIELIRKFSHPNLIHIYDSLFNQNDGTLKILMEYCEEGDLLMYFKKRNRKLATNEILNIFKQISKGFLAMNANGVMHRDLKPENVLVCSNGVIKIADFGCARCLPIEDMTKIANFSLDSGTPIYSSPQQLTGEPYSSKCDIWAAGCLLYLLYFGKHPFFNQTVKQTIEKAESLTKGKEIELPEDTNKTISKIIKSSLVYEDKERSTWRQLFLARVFSRKIEDVNSFLIYIQNMSKIANWMTKQFWKARKDLETQPEKNETYAYFMIKFQSTFNLMGIEIINKNSNYSYLFTEEAFENFHPKFQDQHIKEILNDKIPRLHYFTSIREHLQSKPNFEVIESKDRAHVNAFADLDSSVRACYHILTTILPILKQMKDNDEIIPLIWVLMSKWINFEAQFGYEKNCRIEELFKLTIASPYSVIQSEINKYESGLIDI